VKAITLARALPIAGDEDGAWPRFFATVRQEIGLGVATRSPAPPPPAPDAGLSGASQSGRRLVKKSVNSASTMVRHNQSGFLQIRF
jgi:hypothetical protein